MIIYARSNRETKINAAILTALLFTLCSCSQEGEVVIENLTGGDLEGAINNFSYYLYDGESVSKKIKIGRRFIFGPDEKEVRVTGSGTCKWSFSETAMVGDEIIWTITLYGDAGYIKLCNYSGYWVDVYLSPCSQTNWGPGAGVVPPDQCATWKVISTCWDLLADGPIGRTTEYGIMIAPCEEKGYAWVRTEGTSGEYVRGDTKILAPDTAEDEKSKTKTMDPKPCDNVKYKRPRLIHR